MSQIRIQLNADPWGKPLLKVKDGRGNEYSTREIDLYFEDLRDIDVSQSSHEVGEDGRTSPVLLHIRKPIEPIKYDPVYLSETDIDVLIASLNKEHVKALIERIREETAVDIEQELNQ